MVAPTTPLPQWVIGQLTSEIDLLATRIIMGGPITPTIYTFLDFIRATVAHMDNVTNGNEVFIDEITLFAHLPSTIKNSTEPLEQALAAVLKPTLELDVRQDYHNGGVWLKMSET